MAAGEAVVAVFHRRPCHASVYALLQQAALIGRGREGAKTMCDVSTATFSESLFFFLGACVRLYVYLPARLDCFPSSTTIIKLAQDGGRLFATCALRATHSQHHY